MVGPLADRENCAVDGISRKEGKDVGVGGDGRVRRLLPLSLSLSRGRTDADGPSSRHPAVSVDLSLPSPVPLIPQGASPTQPSSAKEGCGSFTYFSLGFPPVRVDAQHISEAKSSLVEISSGQKNARLDRPPSASEVPEAFRKVLSSPESPEIRLLLLSSDSESRSLVSGLSPLPLP